MNYKLIRVEKTKNREGDEEIFVQAQYTNNLGEVIPFAKWITPGEAALYLSDEKAIESVLIPEWEPIANQRHAENKAAEIASQVTVEKVIAALVEAKVMTKSKVGKLSKVEIDHVKNVVHDMDEAKVSDLVESAGLLKK